MEDRNELFKELKLLIKERYELRTKIDCIDIDMREIERKLSIDNYAMSPRGY